MKDRVLILGDDFIGQRVKEELGNEADFSDKQIFSFADAEKQIKRFKPQVIVNCIEHTGRNVDECELDKDRTLMANAFVPLILAEAALRYKIRLVHVSSGCIYHFDYLRDKPVAENKTPDYLELFYSRTKIYSERALELLSAKLPVLILRIRVPLDNKPHPKNILTKLINYKKVIDIPNSVTYIPDFVRAMRHLVRRRARGIYNAVNKGALSYPDLLESYKKYVPDFEYETVAYKNLNLKRTNLILSTKKLEQSGFKVRNINAVLDECVRHYIKCQK